MPDRNGEGHDDEDFLERGPHEAPDVEQPTAIADSWETIVRVVTETEGVTERFRSGASAEDVPAVQRALGVEFPPDMVESYLLHDGQDRGIEFIFGPYRLWPLTDITTNHQQLIKSVAPTALVGFADNGGNTTLAIEITPGAGYGRVVELCDGDEDEHSPGFAALLASLADRLDRGELVWSPAAGGFGTAGDIAVHDQVARRSAAVEDAPTLRSLFDLPAGAEVELVGALTGASHGDRHTLAIPGGAVDLVGSLRGADRYQPIRVRVRVGPSRWFGLLAPVYQIISWEPVDES